MPSDTPTADDVHSIPFQDPRHADDAYVVPLSGGTPWNVGGGVVVCKADLQLTEPQVQVFVIDGTRDGGLSPHRHPWDEIVVVLDGTLELQTAGEPHVVARGSVAVSPAGSMHAIRTVSDTSQFLMITSSDLAAGFFAGLHEQVSIPQHTESKDQ